MKVIALTGLAGSGKDTASFLLQFMSTKARASQPIDIMDLLSGYSSMKFSKLNVGSYDIPVTHHAHIFKFAWPVYQQIGILLGHNPDDLMSDPTFKARTDVTYWGLTGRELLQKVGTECFRDILSPHVWIDVMRRNLQPHIPGAIISDLRFQNEAEFLRKEFGATIIRLTGRSAGVPVKHQSETEVDGIISDYSIINDGSLRGLADQLEYIARDLNILNAKYTWK